MIEDDADVRLELPPEPRVVAAARAAVGRSGALTDGRTDDVRLVVSELVTAAIRQGGLGAADRITVEAWLREEPVRVSVGAPGSGFDPSAGLRRGGGLELVDQLVRAWTVVRADGRTTVTVEL